MGMLEKAIFPKSTDVVLALGHGFECLGFVNCKNLRVFYNLWGLEKDNNQAGFSSSSLQVSFKEKKS